MNRYLYIDGYKKNYKDMNAAMEEFFEQDAIKHFMPGLFNPNLTIQQGAIQCLVDQKITYKL